MIVHSLPRPSDAIKRYGEGSDWDSPYSWPVRREFSRILHRPRPHVGIIYTERFLNSRPLTCFDDETKVIRARAGAILRQLHTPAMKPSPIRLPLLDTYSLHPRTTYGVPKHIYQQSFHSEPAHITIGRGHLACVQYAGGKSYPRRKNLYSDENRNIRDEIKFRSYYNRSKNEDSNTLPTGFAWRLLHLPPKEVRPFKLYRHSRTLPHLDSSENKTDKENTCEDAEVQKPTHKKYQKRYTESLADLETVGRTKSYERTDSTTEPISRKKKIEDEAAANENTSSFDNLTDSTENKRQEEVRVEDPIVINEEEAAPEKKKKKKKDEDTSDKPSVNRSYSRTKSIVQAEKPEDTPEKAPLNRSLSRTQSLLKEEKPTPEPKEEITEKEPISEPAVEEAKTEPIFEKEPTPEITEVPVEEKVEEETLVELSQPDTTQVEPDVEVEEVKQVEHYESPVEEPEIPEETVKESEVFEAAPEKESEVNDSSVVDETAENPNVDQSIDAPERKEEVYQDAEVYEEELEIDSAVKETVSEEVASDEPHNVVSEEPQVEESITQQEATENEAVIANAIEESEDHWQKEDSNAIVDFSETETSSTKYQNRSDDEGVTETRVLDDSFTINSQVQETCEVSYTETSTTAYTREETVIPAGDLTTQDSDVLVISEELESSQDPLNNADQTTDEENVEIQE